MANSDWRIGIADRRTAVDEAFLISAIRYSLFAQAKYALARIV